MPQLVVLTGPLKGNAYPLDLQRWGTHELVLGRAKDCHILVHDAKVSKRHLRFFMDGGRWHVEDLGSRNGILLNGNRVDRGALSMGDEVQVGDVVLAFREDDARDAPRRPLASPRRPAVSLPPEPQAAPEAPEARTGRSTAGPATTPASATPAPTETAATVAQPAPSPALAPPAPAAPECAPPRRRLDSSREMSRTEVKEMVEAVRRARDLIRTEVGRVVIGQSGVVDDLLIGLLARGHCLLEGVPGLAKTLLVSTLASVLDLDFRRIQFTPDLMPADITGTDVLEEDPVSRQRSYKFLRGPIFANILLADEINRTPPKTQAALLEAMQEFRVTASGTTYALTPPFYVLATQNPIEQEGTYPLPEAQLDRFMFKVRVGYPTRDEEVEIVRATTAEGEEEPEVVLGAGDVLRLQKLVRRIPVSDYVLYYAADLARATRPVEAGCPEVVRRYLSWGAGPRASQYLTLGAKARALLDGRVNVTAEDVRAVAPKVLRHRISLNFHAASEGLSADDVVTRLLEKVPEPRDTGGARP